MHFFKSDASEEFYPVCGPEIRAYKCGPSVNCRCDRTRASWAIYCNTETGWCNDSEKTKNLQPDDSYDAYPAGMAGKLYYCHTFSNIGNLQILYQI